MNFSTHTRLLFLCVGILVLGVGVTVFLMRTNSALADEARLIVSACAEAPYRPTCYETEVPKLMDEGFTMEEAFTITSLIQELDTEYRYCHVLGHYLAEKETAKDPSKWKDVVARSPGGLCSNGAIHGAFQERFRVEALPDMDTQELKKELEGICDERGQWIPTGLEQASCMHALGHLTMYVTAGDIQKSLSLCDEVAFSRRGGDFRSLCYDGAFMQIFQPLEPEDLALIQGKEQSRETAPVFCASFAFPYRTSCVGESAALFREEIKANPKELVAHCSVLNGPDRERCTIGLVYYVTAQLEIDPVVMEKYCGVLSGKERGTCFAHAAGRFIEVDWRNGERAVALCRASERYGEQGACFGELIQMSRYNFPKGSDEARSLCEAMPQPWKRTCLERL